MTVQELFETRWSRGVARGAQQVLSDSRSGQKASLAVEALPMIPVLGERLRRRPVWGLAAIAAALVAGIGVGLLLDGASRNEVKTVPVSGVSTTEVESGPTTPTATEAQPPPALSTTPPPTSEAAAERPFAEPASGEAISFDHEPNAFPRVVIDRAEFVISGGYEAISEKTDFDGRHRLNSVTWYRDPLLGFAGPIVVVEAHNDDFLRPTVGTGPTDNSSAVAINRSAGQMFASGDFAAGLGWDDGHGWVTLTYLGVDEGDFITIAESVERDADGRAFLSEAPLGLERADSVIFIGDLSVPDLEAEYDYSLGDVRGDLSIRSSSPNGFVAWLGDRLHGSIEIRNVKIGSIDVAVIAYDDTDRMTAGWVADDLIFELRGNFESLDAFTDALLDIKVVDEDTWQSIVSDVEFFRVFPST